MPVQPVQYHDHEPGTAGLMCVVSFQSIGRSGHLGHDGGLSDTDLSFEGLHFTVAPAPVVPGAELLVLTRKGDGTRPGRAAATYEG